MTQEAESGPEELSTGDRMTLQVESETSEEACIQ